MSNLSALAKALGLNSHPVPASPALFFGQQRNLWKTSLAIDDVTLRQHGCLVGEPDSGIRSQVTHLLTQQTVRGGGWLFIDVHDSPELRNHLANVARKAGRQGQFFVLDLQAPERSHSVNVMQHGDASSLARRVVLGGGVRVSPPIGTDVVTEALVRGLTALFQAVEANKMVLGLRDAAELMRSLTAQRALLHQHPALMVSALEDLTKHAQQLHILSSRLLSLCDAFGGTIDAASPQVDLNEVLKSNGMLYVRLPSALFEANSQVPQLASMLLHSLSCAQAIRMPEHRADINRPTFLCVLQESTRYLSGGSYNFSLARAAGVGVFHVLRRLEGLNTSTDVALANAKTLLLYRTPDIGTTARLTRDVRLSLEQVAQLAELRHGDYFLVQDGVCVAGQAPELKLDSRSWMPNSHASKPFGTRLNLAELTALQTMKQEP